MNISVIFTGGTIGSQLSDGWITPDGSCPDALLSRILQRADMQDLSLRTLSPYTTLSENITAAHINTLIKTVCEEANSGCDGIIITHGTDTLQYTAAAVALAVGDALPVVFCSAQLPAADPRSNAKDNVLAAVALIRAKRNGVFVTYRNNDGVVYCHHPLYLTRHGECSDDLFSLDGQVAGTVSDGAFAENPAFVPPRDFAVGAFTLCEQADILNILVHPADPYRYDLTDVKAILLQPYHSGTLNTDSAAFLAFCDRARQAGIPIVAANMPLGVTYASGKALRQLPILTTHTAAIPTFMRMWAAISRDEDVAACILSLKGGLL